MDSSDDIPSHVILGEIITRTSQETLGRSRAVCKAWNKATYESSFNNKFLRRTKTVSGFFIQSLKNNKRSSTFISMDGTNSKLSLSFLPRNIKIEACTKQGLLLCKDENPAKSMIPRYILCKPTTKQWRKIPNPKTRYFMRKTAMVVFGSNHNLRFKIVRFSEPKRDRVLSTKSTFFSILRCEIFDSQTWLWKLLPRNMMFPQCENLDFKAHMISTSGFLHSLTTEKRIFAFDLEKESWEIFALPYPLCEDDYCQDYDMKLVECEGKLGLICMVRENCMELWVVEDYYGRRTWTKRHKFSLERLIIRSSEERFIYPEALCYNDVALIKSSSEITFYNFQTSTFGDIKLGKILSGHDEFFPIESDCETLELLDVSPKRL